MEPHVSRWLERDPDPQTRAELESWVHGHNESEVAAAFAGRLQFGTAGLRGLVGVGPARMNRLVVRETTLGLARYLEAHVVQAQTRGLVVGFDGRVDSQRFSEDAAGVLGALGWVVWLLEGPQPTPLGAFAVKHLNAAGGVVITASHNPPAYNGYKVFWENGAQIVPPHDAGIADAIQQGTRESPPWCTLGDLARDGRLRRMGRTLHESYLEAVTSLSVHQQRATRKSFGIAYTAMHGVGTPLALEALQRAGFETIHPVASQCAPDGTFPTVSFPNPEEPGAMDAVLQRAQETGAALACAHDPDADRLAVAVRGPSGVYRVLSGDEVGVLLGADLIDEHGLPATMGATVVSSRMLEAVALARGANFFVTLTGFKWIAKEAENRQQRGERFLFGYEEALGYAIGDCVRDKDGISALVAVAELAEHLSESNRTLEDRLLELYMEVGIYRTSQRSLSLEKVRANPGDQLRKQPLDTIAGRAVVTYSDLLRQERFHQGQPQAPLPLPTADVLIYDLEDNSRVIVRPSGTEPKLKCYYEVCLSAPSRLTLQHDVQVANDRLQALIASHQQWLAGFF